MACVVLCSTLYCSVLVWYIRVHLLCSWYIVWWLVHCMVAGILYGGWYIVWGLGFMLGGGGARWA